MLIKNLLRVLLMLIAGLLSYQASAASKYPASDYQPKIVYQSQEVLDYIYPPPTQDSGAPVAELLMILLLGGGIAYLYNTKYKNTKIVSQAAVSYRPVVEPAVVSEESRIQSNVPQIKRINKAYKGYRSKQLAE